MSEEIDKYRNYKGNISHCKATRCPILLNLLDKTDNLQKQLQAHKEKEDKLRELLGNYKHYSSPTEKQLYENEDIVAKAYKILDGRDE